jgi:uncharacterized protein (TIGR03089 family)
MSTDPTPATTPVGLLRAALAADPARPLVTYYDDATGERLELSVATVDNWVAKTANLLVDGLGVGPGARIALLLPPHWQAAVWLLACWAAGATAASGGDPRLADVAVCGPDQLDRARAAPEVVALSLRPLGAPFPTPLPAGVLDYGVEVRAYGDRFSPLQPADPALIMADGAQVTTDRLVGEARGLAAREGLQLGERILTDRSLDTLDGIGIALLAPLLLNGSVVLCPRLDLLDASAVRRRVDQERVTMVADRCGTHRVG